MPKSEKSERDLRGSRHSMMSEPARKFWKVLGAPVPEKTETKDDYETDIEPPRSKKTGKKLEGSTHSKMSEPAKKFWKLIGFGPWIDD